MRKKASKSHSIAGLKSKPNNLKSFLLGGLSAVIMGISLVYPQLCFLAYISLVPLIWAINDRSFLFKAKIGIFTGIVYYAIALYWTKIFGLPAYGAAVLIESLSILLFAVFLPGTNALMRYVFTPSIWVTLQWLRSFGMFAFTWGSFAHIMINATYIHRIMAYAGVWSIEFIVCLANIAIADLISMKKFKPFIVAAMIIFACYQFGYIANAEKDKKTDVNIMSFAENKTIMSQAVKYCRTDGKTKAKITYKTTFGSDWFAYLCTGFCCFVLVENKRKKSRSN